MILNLDKNFAPLGEGIDFNSFVFAGGEVHIKGLVYSGDWTLTARIKNSDDVMLLLMATDALRRCRKGAIDLFIPYVPYARQDRVMVDGEPLSIKVFCDLINAQNYSSVTIYDVHSDVTPALLNNCIALKNHSFVHQCLNDKFDYFVVSPDAGAYKKIFGLCQAIDYKDEIIMCNKLRNVENGNLLSVTVSHEDLKGKDCYIVDDICDGGGTFALLATELRKRNCGAVNLIVSHGIFSKGLEIEGVDKIYVTDSFKDVQESSKLKQIKLCSIL